MKTFLISGVALALLAVAAHAQDITPGGIGGPGAPVGPGPAGAPQNGAPKAPHSRAAHFILQGGDAMVDVKCADDDSMKTCADITLQFLDKLVALPRGGDGRGGGDVGRDR
jgi:hypothetical protein